MNGLQLIQYSLCHYFIRSQKNVLHISSQKWTLLNNLIIPRGWLGVADNCTKPYISFIICSYGCKSRFTASPFMFTLARNHHICISTCLREKDANTVLISAILARITNSSQLLLSHQVSKHCLQINCGEEWTYDTFYKWWTLLVSIREIFLASILTSNIVVKFDNNKAYRVQSTEYHTWRCPPNAVFV